MMCGYGPGGETYGPSRTSSLGFAVRIGGILPLDAGSGVQRRVKYHSACVAQLSIVALQFGELGAELWEGAGAVCARD